MAAQAIHRSGGKHLNRGWAALAAAAILLWPTLVTPAAAISTIPIISRITGQVVVRSAAGVSHNLVSVEPLKASELLTTGAHALASVSLEGVGKLRIGPSTAAKVAAPNGTLSLDLASGSTCARADTTAVGVGAGNVEVIPTSPSTIFDAVNDSSGLTVAVFLGSVSVRGAKTDFSASAGHAFVVSHEGDTANAALEGVLPSFTSLDCPDPEVIDSARAIAAQRNGGGGGGGGGIIGVLLGLGAIAAALGGHGGGGGSGSGGPSPAPSSNPTPPPTPPPTPTPTPGPLTATPSSMTFSGPAQMQSLMVSESNYSGPFTVTSGDTTVATVSGSGSGPGPVTFTISSVNPGSTTLTVTDNHSGSQSVTVTVEGPLTVSTNSISIVGTGNTANFTASESFYSGAISASSSDMTVATVSGSGNGPGPVMFTVTAVAAGNANIQVTDDHNGTQTVMVSVTIGSESVNPATLSFSGPSDSAKTFNASDTNANHHTTWSAVSSDQTIATVSPLVQVGNSPMTFTVTPVANGKATITVTDDNGTAVVSVGVGVSPLFKTHRTAQPPPPAQPNPIVATPAPRPNSQPLSRLMVSASSLTFTGSAQTRSLSVTEFGYSGPISAVVIGSPVVALDHQSGPGPAQNFILISRSSGTALIRISDNHGAVALVSVTVTPPTAATPPPTVPTPRPPAATPPPIHPPSPNPRPSGLRPPS